MNQVIARWPWPNSTIQLDVDAAKAKLEELQKRVGWRRFREMHPLCSKLLSLIKDKSISGKIDVAVEMITEESVSFRFPDNWIFQLAPEYFSGTEISEIVEKRKAERDAKEEAARLAAKPQKKAKVTATVPDLTPKTTVTQKFTTKSPRGSSRS